MERRTFVAVALALAAAACLPPPPVPLVPVATEIQYAPIAPPSGYGEGAVASYPPFPGATWIEGHWTWTGVQFVWVGGGWSRPTDGAVWMPHRWVHAPGGGWRMVPGYWEVRAPRRGR